jgi:hypothetical protein
MLPSQNSTKPDICRLTMPDKKGLFAYVQNGRWVTIAESGQKVIAAPVINDKRTVCELLVVEPIKGSRLHPITDPLELRVAAALIELAQQAFPRSPKRRADKWNNEAKDYTQAATMDAISIPAWKVATCLLWSQWEEDKDTTDTRAAFLRQLGHNVTAEKLKDALKRDAALKLLRAVKTKQGAE